VLFISNVETVYPAKYLPREYVKDEEQETADCSL